MCLWLGLCPELLWGAYSAFMEREGKKGGGEEGRRR